jgi:hypothetical protein
MDIWIHFEMLEGPRCEVLGVQVVFGLGWHDRVCCHYVWDRCVAPASLASALWSLVLGPHRLQRRWQQWRHRLWLPVGIQPAPGQDAGAAAFFRAVFKWCRCCCCLMILGWLFATHSGQLCQTMLCLGVVYTGAWSHAQPGCRWHGSMGTGTDDFWVAKVPGDSECHPKGRISWGGIWPLCDWWFLGGELPGVSECHP